MINLKYDPVFKYLCVQNCIYHVLNTLGCNSSKQLMRCPINFCAQKIYDPDSVYKILFKKPNTNECVLPFVDIKIFSSEDEKKIWDENKTMIKNGMPFIAMVDVYYLHYRKEYHVLHGSHAVIVVDYFENNDSVKIVDWYEPYFFIGLIKRKDFMKARSSENPKCDNPYSGIAIMNEWIYIVPKKYENSAKDCLLENLSLSLNISEDNTEKMYGISSIESIIRLTANGASNTYFKELHETLFPLWRLYDLLFSNIQEVLCNYSGNQKYINFLLEYNTKFHELLFLILKLSIRNNETSYNHFLKIINLFYNSTIKLYDILHNIYTLIY